MSADIFKWRIATTEAGLLKGPFFRRGLPSPSQVQFRDHSIRVKQGEGATVKHGYKNAEILWTKLSPIQSREIRDLVDFALDNTGLLYVTIKPLDGTGVDWMDLSGKPNLSDIAPDAPIVGAEGYVQSDIILNLNSIVVLDTTPTF